MSHQPGVLVRTVGPKRMNRFDGPMAPNSCPKLSMAKKMDPCFWPYPKQICLLLPYVYRHYPYLKQYIKLYIYIVYLLPYRHYQRLTSCRSVPLTSLPRREATVDGRRSDGGPDRVGDIRPSGLEMERGGGKHPSAWFHMRSFETSAKGQRNLLLQKDILEKSSKINKKKEGHGPKKD